MKKFVIPAIIIALLIPIAVISAIKLNGVSQPKKDGQAKPDSNESTKNTEISSPVKAVWIYYLELAEATADKKSYTAKIDSMFSDIKELGYNTAFVQVRAFADAFYKSEYYPDSKYLCDGEPDFDALKIICEAAKKHGISVHAWINPYRINYLYDSEKEINDNYPLSSATIKTNSVVIYDPGNSAAKELILNGVREIIENYNVSGIHIDDYFYPSDIGNSDSASYSKYKSNSGTLDLDSWRRSNVNSLVKDIYALIKSKDKNLILSISPSADIGKNYNTYYADVYDWCGNPGYCDWIIPQIYFGFNNSNMPFVSTLNSWENLIKNDSVKLIVGLPAYKLGITDEFAGDGKNEFIDNPNIISEEIKEVLAHSSCSGYSIYSYSFLGKIK